MRFSPISKDSVPRCCVLAYPYSLCDGHAELSGAARVEGPADDGTPLRWTIDNRCACKTSLCLHVCITIISSPPLSPSLLPPFSLLSPPFSPRTRPIPTVYILLPSYPFLLQFSLPHPSLFSCYCGHYRYYTANLRVLVASGEGEIDTRDEALRCADGFVALINTSEVGPSVSRVCLLRHSTNIYIYIYIPHPMGASVFPGLDFIPVTCRLAAICRGVSVICLVVERNIAIGHLF